MPDLVLVTGANGFVARAVLDRLARQDVGRLSPGLRGAVRRADVGVPTDVDRAVVGDIDARTEWRAALSGVTHVVHTAARVHVMRDTEVDVAGAYRRVNVEGTVRLAEQAAAAGVRRFVFLSSVKVNGERTDPGTPFTEVSAPISRGAGSDPYGVSKLEAEEALRALALTSGMEIVIVRPPLVYGPGVRANFRALLHAVQRGIPLPFASIRNRRSLVGSGNLADFLAVVLHAPAAANETFLVSDAADLSTPELVRRMGVALQTVPRLVPIPPGMLVAAAGILGRGDAARRLTESLQVDITKARRLLGWTPPLSIDTQLQLTIAGLGSHRT